MQTAQSNHRRIKRLGAMAVASVMLLGAVVPAYATVSQLPGLYMTPPDANVMFTLDDSLSMLSDAIPDVDRANQKDNTVKMPNYDGTDSNSDALSNGVLNVYAQFPGMWKKGSAYWGTTYYQAANKYARFFRSSAGNPLYYDPTVLYTPWPQVAADKTASANANAAKVNISQTNPFDTTFTRDLTTRVNVSGTATDPDNDTKNFWPATYFVYKSTTAMLAGNPNDANNVASNFTKVEIKTASLTPTFARPTKTLSDGTVIANDSRTDCGPTTTLTCSFAVEQQNFANWLQYYRSRMLMAKGGVAAAFAQQGTNLRIGYGTINTSGTVVQGVAPFAGTRRNSFYTALYGSVPTGGGTQLRRAMDDVGKYFQRSNAGNPWALDPTSSAVGKEYTCRRSFHVLSTDGFWNGSGASVEAAKDNDTFTGGTPTKPDNTFYLYANSASQSSDPLDGQFTQDPFRDGIGDTLADVAAYYWKTDLRGDLANEVPSSSRDPAFWQHLATYTVGLGVNGTGNVARASDGSKTVPMSELATSALYNFRGMGWLSKQEIRDYLVTNRVAMTWTKPAADSAQTGDDLIHASMNGRGKYFSASDPTTLRVSLAQALAEAGDNPGSLVNVVAQSAQVSAGSAVYQGTYNPAQWSGRFYAFPQAADGSVNSAPSNALWEASNKMPAPASRNIFTWNRTAKLGTPFLWTNLTKSQQSSLGDDSTVLDFLRGSNANEASKGGLLRDRARYTVAGVTGGVLGDVVNGSPIEGPSDGAGYDRLPSGTPGQSTYAAYRSSSSTTLDNMRNTLFLGANDGMLHAFDRTNGVERFAFVPNSVYSVPRSQTGTELKLKMLSDPAYAHRFLVDGPLQIADAFLGPDTASATWKTVLVGSTGAGARSVFAIDVSNPVVGSGTFGTSSLLWELSEADNSDIGYVTGYVNVARMRDGTWVAIFGNGLDSLNGQAKLFIVDLRTGAIVWQQAVGAAGGNGLSQPNFTLNSNREVTAIYAGDLKGNLWKFDVTDPDKTKWKVAFGSAPNYAPLFAGSTTQPITVMPELTFHPSDGVMVTFGTGKLLETEDTNSIAPPGSGSNVNLNQQAIYGIWDKPSTPGFALTDNLLVQQGTNTDLAAAADSTAKLSGTTTNAIDWTKSSRGWYLNLQEGGERVNVNPEQVNSVLLVVTNKPDADPCKSGGTSRLFVLDPINGSAPSFAVFDSDGAGGITKQDRGYNVKAFTFGVLSLPTLQSQKLGINAVTSERAGNRGQTGARLGGVEQGRGGSTGSTDCTKWLLAGGSNASIAGLPIATCNPGPPRVSWRQLK